MPDIKIEETYYPNGSLKTKATSIDGKRYGTFIRYYADGKIQETIDYKNGKVHGYQRLYDENGEMTYEASYYNDKRHGATIEYSKSKVSNHYLYVDGKLHTRWVSGL